MLKVSNYAHAKVKTKSINSADQSCTGVIGLVARGIGRCLRSLNRRDRYSAVEAQPGLLGGRDETSTKICNALEHGGIEFIDENGGGPGVRLRKRQEKQD